MSKINWDKPIEFLNGARWIPARVVVRDLKSRGFDSGATYGILYESIDPYGATRESVETFYRCDVNGRYNGAQKVRNVVKKTKLYGVIYKIGETDTNYHSSTMLYPTKKEAEEAKLGYGLVFVGTFSTEVIEDVSA